MFSDKNIISVTDKAAERVKYLINKGDENVKGLRIGVNLLVVQALSIM